MDAAWGSVPKLIRQDDAAERFPTITGAGQSVAIIDTGVDYTMPYLGGGFGIGHKVIGGWDFVDNDADPMDTYGHGTNVAGIIAADPYEFDGFHYQGIAPGANLVALRVDSADDPVPAERIRAALQWVIDHQAQFNIVAANISFGEGNYAGNQFSLYSSQLSTLEKNGVFVSAAAGNGGVQSPAGVQYPAADPSVFAVGAVDSFDRITEWTSRGKNLDILAPGDSVPTTSAGPNHFEFVSGTSFSTPMISGAIALLKQANPDLLVHDLRSLLRIAGISNKDGDTEFGTTTEMTFPRLDLTSSINLANRWRPGPLASTGELASTTGSSIAYDSEGVLHAVYYDPFSKKLEYTVRLTNGKLASAGPVELSGDDVGQYAALAIDGQGRPGVAYFDGTHGDLRYAHFNGADWETQTIESKGSVGLYPSLIFNDQDQPIISYYRKSGGDLRLAWFDGAAWSVMNLDGAGDVGRSTSMARSATGELAIAYEHSGLGMLKVIRDGGTGNWTISVADAGTQGVGFISLAFNKQNQPAVAYYNASPANLKYAKFDAGSWSSQTLASKGAQGLYPKLFFDRVGKASILYYSRRNNAMMRLVDDVAGWTGSVLQSGGGKYITFANHDDSVTYTWFRTADGKLLFGGFDLPKNPLPFGG